MLRAFFCDVEFDGGTKEIEKAKADWGIIPPKSGSVRFRTPAMRVKAESPALGAYEDVKSMTFLLRTLATGGGVAPHWLGEPEDANRSTAESMDLPVMRGLVDFQAEWRRNMTRAARFAVDAKVAAGSLAAVLPEVEGGRPVTGSERPTRELLEVVVPEIDAKGVERAAASIAAVATAFGPLEAMGAVGIDTIRGVIRHLLPALGVPAGELPDPDDERVAASALRSFARRDTGEIAAAVEEAQRAAARRA